MPYFNDWNIPRCPDISQDSIWDHTLLPHYTLSWGSCDLGHCDHKLLQYWWNILSTLGLGIEDLTLSLYCIQHVWRENYGWDIFKLSGSWDYGMLHYMTWTFQGMFSFAHSKSWSLWERPHTLLIDPPLHVAHVSPTIILTSAAHFVLRKTHSSFHE